MQFSSPRQGSSSQSGHLSPSQQVYQPPLQVYQPPPQVYQPPPQAYQPPPQAYQSFPQVCQPPLQVYQPLLQVYQPPLQVYQPPLQVYQPLLQVYQPLLQVYQPPPQVYQPPPQAFQPPPQAYKFVLPSREDLFNIQKYSMYAQLFETFRNQNPKKINTETENLQSKFPHLIFDNNHIYRFDYSNRNTAYYNCVNKNITNIKCKARKILKDGKLEDPSQKENLLHHGEDCSLENLEKNMFYKNQIYLMRSKIWDLFINNRNLSSRELHYQSLKWQNSC